MTKPIQPITATSKAPETQSTGKLPPTVILFDWGDTLMVDYPDTPGKMCNWPTVTVVEGAEKALRQLAVNASLYVATGAADSSQDDIHAAFKRVGVDRYLSGYFCQSNVGVAKGSEQFLPRILQQLGAKREHIAMVGDNFDKDIKPALAAGIRAVWLNREPNAGVAAHRQPLLNQISSLQQLYPLLFPDNGVKPCD